ncbi:MAG: hypothetical protein HPY70_07850 [Firmicutes bacterium]|nr:hypothetical protein [Bacillota bacterium]
MLSRVHIFQKKISCPLISPKVLPRSLYKRWAEDLITNKLVVLTAPAGYGKTTSLTCAVKFLMGEDTIFDDSHPNSGFPQCNIAWYSLSEEDSLISVFFAHLVESLCQAVPAFGRQAQRTLYSVADLKREYNLVVSELCEELWQWEGQSEKKQVVIIFDDYHLGEKAREINEILKQLLTESPPFVHFCLSGRKRPQLPLQNLGLKYPVKEIGVPELSFTPVEIEALFEKKFSLKISNYHIKQITRQTEGWPAGIVLTAQVLKGRPVEQYDNILASPVMHKEKIFEYFAEEVLHQQPLSTQEFLTESALLKNLTPEACKAILGLKNADIEIKRMYDSGLFLIAVEEGENSVYRFHHLFADFLRKTLSRTKGVDYIRKIHLKAARYYEKEGDLDIALDHLWAAGDTTGAVEFIKRYAQELIDRGYIDQVRCWLDQVPADLQDDPYFFYLKGFIHQPSDHPFAISCFEKASKAFAEQGKTQLLVRSLIYMTTIYSLQNRVDKVTETASRIPLVSALTRDPWSRGVLVVSALCQSAWNDNLRRAQWLIKLAQRFTLEPDWRWAMLAYSCMVYYRLGELDLARRYITEALSMPVVYNNDVWRGMALILYHVVLYSQDDEVEGNRVREELWEIGEKYNSFYYMAYAERARAFPYLHRGQWEKAEELLRSSLYFFSRAGNEAMALITKLNLALLASCRGRAAHVLEDARNAFQELCSLHCGQGLLELGQSLLGVVAREAGELKLAEDMLLASARASKRKGAKQILAGTYMHLSRLYHQRGQTKKGNSYLRQALHLAEANRYVIFWDWHPPTILQQCLYAVQKNIYPEYANHLLQYWFKEEQKEAAEWKRIRPVPKNIPVEIYCFGNFEVIVGDKPIPIRAWKTRKVQGLFKYLILQGGRRVSREQLMEIFWPDGSPQAASASLRVSLSRLRNALDFFKQEGMSASFLLGEGKGYLWFRGEKAAFVDIFCFEDCVKEGNKQISLGNIEEGRELLEKARGLFRGQLLTDDLYAEWAISERERFDILYLDLLLTLGDIYSQFTAEEVELFRKSIECYEKAITLNPYREDVYLKLMKAYLTLKERAEAIRVYQKCLTMLKKEFNLRPGKELQLLVKKIKEENINRRNRTN